MADFRAAGAMLVVLLLGGCGASRPGVVDRVARGAPPEPALIGAEGPARSAKIGVPKGPEENQAHTERRGFPEYLIGSGDALQILLRAGAEAQEQPLMVRPDGVISYMFLDDIKASGLTPGELDSVLTEKLTEYYKEPPRIDVIVTAYNSKKVSLLGAIFRAVGATGPGRFGLRGKTTALDLILEAGGPEMDAMLETVRLTRGGHTYTLNLQRALYEGDPSDNVILEGNDMLFVPGAGQISKKALILGEVGSPGIYEFEEDVSVLEAILRAGGFTSDAVKQNMKIVRGDPENPEMLTINIDGILHEADIAQNVVLKDGDIVYVPRDFLGSVNEVITRIDPVLTFLMWPSTYRTMYTTGGGLRLDTGPPPERTPIPTLTQMLPSGAATGTTGTTTPVTGAAAAKRIAGEKEEKEEGE